LRNIKKIDNEEEIVEKEEYNEDENSQEFNSELDGQSIEVDEDFGESETNDTTLVSTMEESSNTENNVKYKILTQEDWEKIQEIQNNQVYKDHTKVPLKRKLEQLYDFEIDSKTITGFQKKRKTNKEEKLESVLDGRMEFEVKKKPQFKSKTNDEKKKTKPYNMLRHKALSKMTLSNSQKKRKTLDTCPKEKT